MSDKTQQIRAVKRTDVERKTQDEVSVEIAHMYVLMERYREKARDYLFRTRKPQDVAA